MFACKASNSCHVCGNSDQTTDTVKVDMNFDGLKEAKEDKENMSPTTAVKRNLLGQAELDRRLQAEEDKRKFEEESEQERLRQERKEREAEEQRLRLEQRRVEEERRRQEEEAEERERLEQEERRIKMELEESHRVKEAEKQAAGEREREAEQRRQEELARVAKEKEQVELQSKLQSFLASAGFQGVNEKKKVKTGILSSGFTYPLHAAVKANDPKTVELLLWGGANRALTDSKRLKPLDLAKKLNKDDSHKHEIAVLTTVSSE